MQPVDTAGNALLDAINRNKVHLATFIVDAVENNAGEVINFRDFKGKTPITRAVYITEEKSRQRALLMLLKKGANPNLRDDFGRTALSYACELRHNDVVRILIKWNVDPDLPDCKGMTPLMYCSTVGNDIGIGLIIRSFRRLGLAVDRENDEGFTALHLAARQGHMECANRLAVEGHASTTQTDRNYGRSAEEWARAEGCTTPEVALISQYETPRRFRQSLAASQYGYHPSSPTRNRCGSPHKLLKQPSSLTRMSESTSLSGSYLSHISPLNGPMRPHQSPTRHEGIRHYKSPSPHRINHAKSVLQTVVRQGNVSVSMFDSNEDDATDTGKSLTTNTRILNRSRISAANFATDK